MIVLNPHCTLQDYITHLFAHNVVSDIFWPVLSHHEGSHSYTALGITAAFAYVPYIH